MAKKGFYLFRDPLGTDAVKQGITGSWESRLGVYQNSYSRKSHTACFNAVWVGGDTAINELEKVVRAEAPSILIIAIANIESAALLDIERRCRALKISLRMLKNF